MGLDRHKIVGFLDGYKNRDLITVESLREERIIRLIRDGILRRVQTVVSENNKGFSFLYDDITKNDFMDFSDLYARMIFYSGILDDDREDLVINDLCSGTGLLGLSAVLSLGPDQKPILNCVDKDINPSYRFLSYKHEMRRASDQSLKFHVMDLSGFFDSSMLYAGSYWFLSLPEDTITLITQNLISNYRKPDSVVISPCPCHCYEEDSFLGYELGADFDEEYRLVKKKWLISGAERNHVARLKLDTLRCRLINERNPDLEARVISTGDFNLIVVRRKSW